MTNARWFDRFAGHAADAAGSSVAFLGFAIIVAVWLLCGPLLGFSDAWQLLINTPTTIATTGLVFLIQHTQNADSDQVHIENQVLGRKLDEVLRRLDAQEGDGR